MFNKKGMEGPGSFDTLIGANTTFDGSIVSEGTIRIDGQLNGDLKVNGDVIVGDKAIVKGNINAKNVYLSGTVEGNITSTGILRILTTARLFGDIKVHSFVADEGGLFQGKCSMLETSELQKADSKGSPVKLASNKDYKKSSVLEQIYDEKENAN